MLTTRPAFVLLAAWLLMSASVLLPAWGQSNGPSAAEINQFLNGTDGAVSPWNTAPQMPAQLPQAPTGTAFPPRMQTWPLQRQAGTDTGSRWPANLFQQRTSGTQRSATPAQNPFKMSRQDLLKMFLGGSGSSSASANPQKFYDASAALQSAVDQAAQAEAAASRASYGSDQGARLSAAAEAQNHANAARGAADQATSVAAGGSSEAQDAAAQARNAADRAQYAADRAAANANNSGW